MSKNVTILVIILALVVLAGYLVWLRGKFSTPVEASPSPEISAMPSPTLSPSPSATTSASPVASVSASPKAASASGRTVR